MDKLRSLSTGAQITLLALVLYVINSFLPWQKACVGAGGFNVCASKSEWSGIGVLAVLVGIVFLVWEAWPLVAVRPALGSVHPRLVSVGLGAVLVLLTVITALSHNEARKIWSWIGVLLSIVAAAAAVSESRREGIDLQSEARGAMGSFSRPGSSTASAPPPPPAPERPASAPPAAPPDSGDEQRPL